MRKRPERPDAASIVLDQVPPEAALVQELEQLEQRAHKVRLLLQCVRQMSDRVPPEPPVVALGVTR